MDRRPPCMHCHAPTSLVRAEPHPVLGQGWELVIFQCTACGKTTTRTKAPPPQERRED